MIVFDMLLDGLGYWTARLLVPALSLGYVQVERATSSEMGFNLFGLKKTGNGHAHLLSATMAGWVGLFFWIFAFCLFLYVAR